MAGSLRFEMSSASPDDLAYAGGYPNGLSRNYSSASLDRSGSFREGSENRMFSSGGGSTPRGNAISTGNLPPLPQCLMLDPITMGDQKSISLGELRRVLGISFGGSVEDNPFGAAHLKPPHPVATEELKGLKASVLDATNRARVRAKRLDESIDKLNRYCEALNLKKQRNEFTTNERSGGSNLLKMGAHINRNSPDLMNQRLEERTKTAVMNRRVRSSVSEIRAEGRSNMLTRQPMAIGKDRDMLRGEGSDLAEEKIRRLPAGGEVWDKKMTKKRYVGTVFSRPMDGDVDLKKTLHHKPNDESGPQACDAQSFRSGSFNGGNGVNKLDTTSLSSANARVMLKNEVDKVSVSRDLMSGLSKERLVPKGNNKLNVRDDSQMPSPNPVTKGKASRAPRNGPTIACNSSPNFPRTSGAPEGWEQPPSVNKNNFVSGATNRKRPLPTGSASPPMAQWVGQRPQKFSRTRRANLVSPVSNHDEVQIPSEVCSPSDVGARVNSFGTNGQIQKSVANCAKQIRVKQEIVSSPARISESDESGAGENRESRLKEKGPGSGEVDERAVNDFQNTGCFILPTKKNKLLNKEETGVGVRRQGRSGRGSSVSRAAREKFETPPSAKPLKIMRPGSERNGSKSGRPPLKKLSDRKAFAGPGHISINGSPDCTGESDDDREELLAAANFACNASNFACSSSFWKKMEPIFGPVSLEEASYLKEQLNQLISMEGNDECISPKFGNGNTFSGEILHEENFVPKTLVSGLERNLQDQIKKGGISCGRLDSEGMKKVPPLYQRVLSALIMEDDIEEFEKDIDWKSMSLQHNGDNPPGASINPMSRVGIQFANQTNLGSQTLNQCSVDSFPCNGTTDFSNATRISNQLFNDDLSILHSEIGMFPAFPENGADGLLRVCINSSGISSFDCPYEQMSLEDRLLLELQSVGLYQETAPDLADGDDEAIDRDIVGLQKLLHQQLGGKKMKLNKFVKAIEEDTEIERRRREQVAMDKLVELAYKKLLATRGSIASKYGIAKVPRPVAIAFIKRTLSRCRKYEETGKSCFSEPALRDVIFSAALHRSNAEPMKCNGLSLPSENHNSQQACGVPGSSDWAEQHDDQNKYGKGFCGIFGSGTHPSEQDFAKPGPILNRGRKKEVLLDDVGNPSLKASSNLGTMLGRAKGKRSERERDKDASARNSVSKAGRQSLGNNKGERKTKSKPKQKTAQLSTSGNGLVSNAPSASGFIDVVGNSNNRKREVDSISYNDNTVGPSETKKQMDFANLPSNEIDSIELVGNELGGNQDLSTWLNFDDDGLQDHDAEGLDIPMDDLADLNMLL